ncbi:GntR family transcriptional regulator [Streptomyces cinereoruber]|uniref:GntR family transcriptional regulator n=1 Tax=Streptomyces cinereoruber TaxID=67260 RepID=UPI003C2FC235
MTDARVGYADVAEVYRQRIKDGDLRPGDALPTINGLAEEHGVARNTAARAVALLKSEGLIVTRAGAGTVVAEAPMVISGTDRLERLNRTGRKFARGEDVTGRRVMRRSCVDPRICRELDIEPGDEVILRIRTFRMDGKPTTVGVSVIHSRATADVPEVAEEAQMERFWQELYRERTGREIVKGERTATARQASQDELDALEIDAPPHVAVSVLVTHVTFHDETGPIEHWEDVYAPGAEIPLTL